MGLDELWSGGPDRRSLLAHTRERTDTTNKIRPHQGALSHVHHGTFIRSALDDPDRTDTTDISHVQYRYGDWSSSYFSFWLWHFAMTASETYTRFWDFAMTDNELPRIIFFVPLQKSHNPLYATSSDDDPHNKLSLLCLILLRKPHLVLAYYLHCSSTVDGEYPM
jgi:hypothetical protein